MEKSERIKTTTGLYLNYLVHGMAIVILAQNMSALGHQWHVANAGVAMVISSLGIGRLLVLYLSGLLSDRLGRKLFVMLGVITYIPFFIGIIISRSTVTAYGFGILAGMANSFLDSGTYPALMELYPQTQATANIMIKAFASVGELLLPMLVAFLDSQDQWFGWSFILCALLLFCNLLFLTRRQFPRDSRVTSDSATDVEHKKPLVTSSQLLSGGILTVFGYVSMSTFYLISQWLTVYGESVVHLSLTAARLLVSFYSIGSILGVILTAALVDRVFQPIWIMLVSTTISFGCLLAMAAFPIGIVMTLGAFIIGISAAGGVMQVGLTIMSKLFPSRKGLVTGVYYTASGLASFTIPIITGIISKINIRAIMWLDVFIAFVGLLCSLMIILLKRVPTEKGK